MALQVCLMHVYSTLFLPLTAVTISQGINSEGLEFSRRLQERRIVDEDREEYELLTPNQADLEVREHVCW